MKIEIDLLEKTGMAIARCSGVFNKTDAINGVLALWKNPGWSGKAAVWDFTGARFEINSSEAEEIADFILKNQPKIPPLKVAFVTPRDLEFGMTRVYQAYRKDDKTDFKVFRNYDEAMLWAQEH